MKIWNLKTALANTDDDLQLLATLLEIWLRQCPEFIQTIEDVVARRDVTAVCQVTHKLKGSLQVLGAERAMERTCRAEELTRSGDADPVIAELQNVVAALSELQSSIQSWYDNKGAHGARQAAFPSDKA